MKLNKLRTVLYKIQWLPYLQDSINAYIQRNKHKSQNLVPGVPRYELALRLGKHTLWCSLAKVTPRYEAVDVIDTKHVNWSERPFSKCPDQSDETVFLMFVFDLDSLQFFKRNLQLKNAKCQCNLVRSDFQDFNESRFPLTKDQRSKCQLFGNLSTVVNWLYPN